MKESLLGAALTGVFSIATAWPAASADDKAIVAELDL
jgi:hypothetical protein